MMLPPNRTHTYIEWRACERFGMMPAGVKRSWDDNDWWTQLMLIAYEQIRGEEDVMMAGARMGL